MAWFDDWRAARLIRNSSCRTALAALPAGLEAYWRHSAPQEYKGIRTDAFFFVRAAEGLMEFFDVVAPSGKPCALPSEAADSVWHAWLRWDPVGLERFCIAHFGAAIPHVERAGLGAGALLNSFVACRRREGTAVHAAQLPALFRLDARLKMCGGHGYWNCMGTGHVVHARLDARGLGRRRASPHPELTESALRAAGLGSPRSTGFASSDDTSSFALLASDASGGSYVTAAAHPGVMAAATAAAVVAATAAAVAAVVAAAAAIRTGSLMRFFDLLTEPRVDVILF